MSTVLPRSEMPKKLWTGKTPVCYNGGDYGKRRLIGDESGMRDTAQHNTIRVNGVSLHYAAAGRGRPVILLHGNGESHAIFSVAMEQLAAAGYRVYAPDSRGQGANAPLEAYHYADMAEDIRQFIAALGLDRPALYGFSDGGFVGLLLALEHPGALSLLAVSGVNLSPDGLTDAFREALSREEPSPLMTLMLTEPDIDPGALAAIDIPVLVTAGSDDLIKEEETRRIADALPNAELEILEGEEHETYIVDSDIIGGMLMRFFRKNGY